MAPSQRSQLSTLLLTASGFSFSREAVGGPVVGGRSVGLEALRPGHFPAAPRFALWSPPAFWMENACEGQR